MRDHHTYIHTKGQFRVVKPLTDMNVWNGMKPDNLKKIHMDTEISHILPTDKNVTLYCNLSHWVYMTMQHQTPATLASQRGTLSVLRFQVSFTCPWVWWVPLPVCQIKIILQVFIQSFHQPLTFPNDINVYALLCFQFYF